LRSEDLLLNKDKEVSRLRRDDVTKFNSCISTDLILHSPSRNI
jgi:hypothetical protein